MEPGSAGAFPVKIGPRRPARWLTKGRLDGLAPTLFLHARDRLAEALERGHFKLLHGLAAHAAGQGLAVELVEFSPEGQDRAIAQGGHTHVFLDDRPAYGPNAFHCVPSYLHGFWFFDEVGSRNNSLMRMHKFDPRPMAGDYAKRVHAELVARFVTANLSKFPQAERGAALEAGCLAFFAQDFKAPPHHRHYMSVVQMIEAAIAAKGPRRLYIKPHPNNTVDELAALASYHNPQAGVEVCLASIHDLLAAADCVLTLTSAVGFEAFLHKKPVVLGGQTDFWQNAVTLTNPDRMGDAIAASMARDWPYEKFLVWYLKQMCVEDALWALPRMLEKLHRKGFGWADPGTGFY